MLEFDDLWHLGFLNLLKLAPEKNGRFWSFSTRLSSGSRRSLPKGQHGAKWGQAEMVDDWIISLD
jgi:hypothetical protein